jgi:hypothetical protein
MKLFTICHSLRLLLEVEPCVTELLRFVLCSSGEYEGKRKCNAFSETDLTRTKIPKLTLDQLAALPVIRHGQGLQLNFPDLFI